MIEIIDGALFQLHGHPMPLPAINLEKQSINELNVFPVPDGDTGTNMSLTIGTAAAELKKKAPPPIGAGRRGQRLRPAAGRRGNSGVILSLLFRGFAKSLKGYGDRRRRGRGNRPDRGCGYRLQSRHEARRGHDFDRLPSGRPPGC